MAVDPEYIHLKNKIQENYYSDWDEKDKIIDLMGDKEDLTVKEIEEFIKIQNSL